MNSSLYDLIEWGTEQGNRNKTHVIEQPPGLGAKPTMLIKYHEAHRLAFTFEYSGKQPAVGKCSKFGRYKKTNRYRLEYPEYAARVFAYPRSLLVWIKKPKGIRTVDQLIEARKLARECAKSIAFKYQLTLIREKGAGFSEHTVENRALDRVLRPLVLAEPELMRERCGITENKTSHRNRLEHTDRAKRPGQPAANERVINLEELLYNGAITKEDLAPLKEQVKETIKLTNETSTSIKEITTMIKDLIAHIKESADNTNRLNDTVNTAIIGSIKPPEKPDGGAYR
jgi:hypothetical protein